jgi:pimeloyl-ACP methyl ester carboxylesterase
VVLAPLFSRKRTPRYQRLVAGPTGEKPADAFEFTIDRFQRNVGLNPAPLRLFGYSGGAQFAMRYTLLGNLPVARLALAAPGWFTMPNAKARYPYGLAASKASEGRAPDVRRLLNIPVLLTVGANDTRRDRSLNRKRRINRAQGRTRLERATRWNAAMQAAAVERGMQLTTDFRILPGAGHDFGDNMDVHGLGGLVVNWLID